MADSHESTQVISALELVYQLLRRYYTECTEWEHVTAAELPGELRRRVFAADALLGNSVEEPNSGSDAMKSYNSAIHWLDAYNRELDEVLGLARTGTKPFNPLLCPREYSEEELKSPGSIFFLAGSAKRWAKKLRKVEIPEDAHIRLMLVSERESASPPAHDAAEFAYKTLAELTRQLLKLADPNWKPGQAKKNRTSNRFYRAGKFNLSGLSREVTSKLPKNADEKNDPSRVVKNNFSYVAPLVEGEVGQLEAPSENALPGIWRTVFGLALTIESKLVDDGGNKDRDESPPTWPPQRVIGNLSSPPLLSAAQFRACLITAEANRLK